MPRIKYADINLRKESLERVQQANTIIAEYQAQGLDLTLRQIYYQFVARALIPNNDREYKKLGNIIADARLAGLIDWDAIIDRTRYVRDLSHWTSPQEIVEVCARQFRLNKWRKQPEYVEVWVEKDALIGVLEGVCQEHDVPFMACRGYASASEIWRAGHVRIKNELQRLHDGVCARSATIFYLGDHDPSGIDMTRDVTERLKQFVGADLADNLTVERLALNMEQVEEYTPPPNPTKMSDSRASNKDGTGYADVYGDECWELDALDPTVIRDMIRTAILAHRDETLWAEAVEEENEAKANLAAVAENWDDVLQRLHD